MEIVYLNILGCNVEQPAKEFLAERPGKTDIVCLQEAPKELAVIAGALMQSFWCETTEKAAPFGGFYRLGLLVQAQLQIVKSEVLLTEDGECGIGVVTTLREAGNGKKPLTVGNVHGVPYPGHKLDTPGRIRQTRNIIDGFERVQGPRVIGGDFNLDPKTKSVQMFEEAGYVNLIKEFKIDTTRNNLAWRNWPGKEQMYADYLFVSPEVDIRKFTVPKIQISDHLPMILDFELR